MCEGEGKGYEGEDRGKGKENGIQKRKGPRLTNQKVGAEGGSQMRFRSGRQFQCRINLRSTGAIKILVVENLIVLCWFFYFCLYANTL
jgi:hypothetical protein